MSLFPRYKRLISFLISPSLSKESDKFASLFLGLKSDEAGPVLLRSLQ